MPPTVGTKELKEVLSFTISLGDGIRKALEDGKFTIGDIGHFIPPLMKAGPAFEGFESVSMEAMDLNETEKAELKAFVADEFDVPDDKLEATIESAFNVAADLWSLVKNLIPPAPAQP